MASNPIQRFRPIQWMASTPSAGWGWMGFFAGSVKYRGKKHEWDEIILRTLGYIKMLGDASFSENWTHLFFPKWPQKIVCERPISTSVGFGIDPRSTFEGLFPPKNSLGYSKEPPSTFKKNSARLSCQKPSQSSISPTTSSTKLHISLYTTIHFSFTAHMRWYNNKTTHLLTNSQYPSNTNPSPTAINPHLDRISPPPIL